MKVVSPTGDGRRSRAVFLQQFDRLASQSLRVVAVDRHQHVFRLQVGVNDLALGVKVVQTFQHLLHNSTHA